MDLPSESVVVTPPPVLDPGCDPELVTSKVAAFPFDPEGTELIELLSGWELDPAFSVTGLLSDPLVVAAGLPPHHLDLHWN